MRVFCSLLLMALLPFANASAAESETNSRWNRS
jgi:hypothetical protein